MSRRNPVVKACGHESDNQGRCWMRCTTPTPNSAKNPDPAGRCSYCAIGNMEPRGAINGGVWATCDRCGTSRYIENVA